jgi:hypothetical protein
MYCSFYILVYFFMKNVYPIQRPINENYIENMPYFLNFGMLTCKWCFWYVGFEYLIKKKGKKTVGLFFSYNKNFPKKKKRCLPTYEYEPISWF